MQWHGGALPHKCQMPATWISHCVRDEESVETWRDYLAIHGARSSLHSSTYSFLYSSSQHFVVIVAASVNIYAKPGAGNTGITDLDLLSIAEETDRLHTTAAHGGVCSEEASPGAVGGLELPDWAQSERWSVTAMGPGQECKQGTALPKQIKQTPIPAISRNQEKRWDPSFFQPAISNAVWCSVYQRWFSRLQRGRNDSVESTLSYTPIHELKKIISNENLFQGSRYCVLKHFLCA